MLAVLNKNFSTLWFGRSFLNTQTKYAITFNLRILAPMNNDFVLAGWLCFVPFAQMGFGFLSRSKLIVVQVFPCLSGEGDNFVFLFHFLFLSDRSAHP